MIDVKLVVPAGQTRIAYVKGVTPLTIQHDVNGGTVNIDTTINPQADIEASAAVWTSVVSAGATDGVSTLTGPVRAVRVGAVTAQAVVHIYG